MPNIPANRSTASSISAAPATPSRPSRLRAWRRSRSPPRLARRAKSTQRSWARWTSRTSRSTSRARRAWRYTPPGDAAVVLVLERLADAERRAGRSTRSSRRRECVPRSRNHERGDRFRRRAECPRSHRSLDVAAAALRCITARAHVGVRRCPGWRAQRRGLRAPLGSASCHGAARAPGRHLASPSSPRKCLVCTCFRLADLKSALAALAAGRTSDVGPRVSSSSRPARRELATRSSGHAAARRRGPAPEGVPFRAAPLAGQTAFVFTGAAARTPAWARVSPSRFPALACAVKARFEEMNGSTMWLYGPARTPLRSRSSGARRRLPAPHGPHAPFRSRAAGRDRLLVRRLNALFGLGVWTDLDGMIADAAAGPVHHVARRKFPGGGRAWRSSAPSTTWATCTVLAPVDEVRAAVAGEPIVAHHHLTRPDVVLIGRCRGLRPRALSARARPRRAARLRPRRALPGGRAVSGRVVDAPSPRDAAIPGRAVLPGPPAFEPSRDACADAITEQAMGTFDFRARSSAPTPTACASSWSTARAACARMDQTHPRRARSRGRAARRGGRIAAFFEALNGALRSSRRVSTLEWLHSRSSQRTRARRSPRDRRSSCRRIRRRPRSLALDAARRSLRSPAAPVPEDVSC